MQLYPGTNPCSPLLILLPPASGYGIWPVPQEAEGGDKRSAANLMTGLESLTDRTNLLGWRVSAINPIDGTPQSLAETFTAAIFNYNVWEFFGTINVDPGATFYFFNGAGGYLSISANTTLNVGDTVHGNGIGHIVVTNGSDITAKPGGVIIADGTGGGTAPVIAIKNGAVFSSDASSPVNLAGALNTVGPGVSTLAAPIIQNGSYTKTGAGAITVERAHVITGTNFTIPVANPLQFDSIQCVNTGVSSLQLDSVAPSAANVRLRIWMPGFGLSSGIVTIKDDTGAPICQLNPSGNLLPNGSGTFNCAFVDLLTTSSIVAVGFGHYQIIGGFNFLSP
jgi:hypothetical protein